MKYLSSNGSNVLYNKCDMFSISIRASYLRLPEQISLISDMEHTRVQVSEPGDRAFDTP